MNNIDHLKWKRDIGTASADELAELDAALAASEAALRNSTALVGDNGGLAVPAATLLPSTWDYANGGNAKALEAWAAQAAEATSPTIILGQEPPEDFADTSKDLTADDFAPPK